MTDNEKARKLCQQIYSNLNWIVTAIDGMETMYTRSTIRKDFFDTALSSSREIVNEIKLNGGIEETIERIE